MSIFSALGSFIAGPFGALAGTAVSALLGAKAASDQRKQMISDQDNQFVRMRNAATKAGFNPLTVMRNGGAQMFGGIPTFSKAGFMQQFVQQGYNAWTTHADNDPLKKYNEEVRKLTLEGMRTNIKLDKAQIYNLGKKPKDDTAYLYNDDGTPMKNIFGQHMYVDPNAAAVFPTLQGYITADGETLSLPHEQLLDMGATSLPTAITAIETGRLAAKGVRTPTIFKYPGMTATGERFTYGDLSYGKMINWRN